jgi:hypothetical protein
LRGQGASGLMEATFAAIGMIAGLISFFLRLERIIDKLRNKIAHCQKEGYKNKNRLHHPNIFYFKN